jgi:hypothetical protein
METNTRAKDILEFIIFVGLGDELGFLESMNLGLSESVVKLLARGGGDSCWCHWTRLVQTTSGFGHKTRIRTEEVVVNINGALLIWPWI